MRRAVKNDEQMNDRSDKFGKQIRTALTNWPGDEASRRKMAPPLSYGRQAGPACFDARIGSVVMLLFPGAQGWSLPLTVRPETLSTHAGQICLPGGILEPGETSQQNAARELAEELGIESGIEWLGHFSEFYVYVSNVVVIPWVAISHQRPNWIPEPGEVARVIEFPLATLLSRMSERQTEVLPNFIVPNFFDGQDTIWGATAMMLSELASLLRLIQK